MHKSTTNNYTSKSRQLLDFNINWINNKTLEDQVAYPISLLMELRSCMIWLRWSISELRCSVLPDFYNRESVSITG